MLPEQELEIAEVFSYFSHNIIPFTKVGMQDLVAHTIVLMSSVQMKPIKFQNNRPSLRWVGNVMCRKKLRYRSFCQIEDPSIEAMTPENREHIARVQAVIARYNIRDPNIIFNMNQTGMYFENMVGRSFRKGIGSEQGEFIQRALKTKENLNRVTLMPMVSAAGKAYTLAVIFPGKTCHYTVSHGNTGKPSWCTNGLTFASYV